MKSSNPLPAARAVVLSALLGLAALPAALAAEAKPVFKPDVARGQQLAAACMACHTADGTRGATSNPILQGQHPEYIVKQLQDYKSGKRKNAIMQGMAAPLSDEDMRHIAAFYASKKAPNGAARNTETIALGERIWRGGISDRQVPACAGCHAPNGAGIPAQYPRLQGQHAEYTAAQLTAFRSGARANNVQMTGIAAKMNDREIAAVSDFIAGLR